MQTMVYYYSSLKKNELSRHEKTQRKLKSMLLNERSQSEKTTHCIIPTIWHSGKSKTTKTVKRSLIAKDYQEGVNKQHTKDF